MIRLHDVKVKAGPFSLQHISFEVPTGKYSVLVGESGQGKTTVLEAICGLKKVCAGQIIVDGIDVTDWSPSDREIGFVPQDLALFPTLNVREHLAFALRIRKHSASQIRHRTDELASLLRLTPLLERHVSNLSGGESQRVALGRALSFRPTVLLLDEPLSALDEFARKEMQQLLKQIQQSLQVTILHVTHSAEEANALADQKLMMQHGSVHLLAT